MIDQMLEKISEGLPIDVFSAVKSLRTRRQEMVQGEVRLVATAVYNISQWIRYRFNMFSYILHYLKPSCAAKLKFRCRIFA